MWSKADTPVSEESVEWVIVSEGLGTVNVATKAAKPSVKYGFCYRAFIGHGAPCNVYNNGIALH